LSHKAAGARRSATKRTRAPKQTTSTRNNTETKKSTLSPIEVTLTIDGFSGFSPGQYFHIDGIPEIYNQTGVFQITNIKHNIATDGWNTTIEAGFRITPK
jgi:ATP-dependent helicase/DNAse subunit B